MSKTYKYKIGDVVKLSENTSVSLSTLKFPAGQMNKKQPSLLVGVVTDRMISVRKGFAYSLKWIDKSGEKDAHAYESWSPSCWYEYELDRCNIKDIFDILFNAETELLILI